MKTSENTSELVKALLLARQEIENPHKAKSGYGYKYASLDAIISQTMPILLKNGLVIVQPLTHSDTAQLGVTTRLQHVSGEYFEDTFFPTDAKLSGNAKDNPIQIMGASITYARRYGYCSILCIAAEEDTDGRVVPQSAPVPKPNVQTKIVKKVDPTVCPVGGDGYVGKKWSDLETNVLESAMSAENEAITQAHRDEIAKVLNERNGGK